MKRFVVMLAVVVLFAKEAHVSGGYAECFTDVDGVVCIESDSRKIFRDSEQADGWIAGHRQQAERRLFTLVPRLRVAFAAARRAGLPVAVVDDWRLHGDTVAPTGARRVQLELGTLDRQTIAITFTSTRALTEPERTSLRERLQQELRTPAYEPDREGQGIYAPSLGLMTSAGLAVTPGAPPAPPLAVEDVRTWQPLWVADHHGVPLGMGTTMRVSPLAARVWKPWLQTQLRVLRTAWSATTCALPKGVVGDVPSRFSTVEGFRPWGPLLLGEDVQARVDDGFVVRMVRLRVGSSEEASSIYGELTRCLVAAARPLPGPPSL